MARILRGEIRYADLPKPSWVKMSQIRTLSIKQIDKNLALFPPKKWIWLLKGLTKFLADNPLSCHLPRNMVSSFAVTYEL